MTSGGRRSTPAPRLDRERHYWQQGAYVVGIDEVGRGAWAGPLTLAAVALPPDRRMYKLRDSKMLTASDRERLSDRLHDFCDGAGLGHVSNEDIDSFGLSEAMRRGARRAIAALPQRPDVVLLDGRWDFLADPTITTETIVRGDARCASIAAASIVAKVARDRLLIAADDAHPPYHFASNKGYPSPAHIAALRRHGPCALHRHSWAPVAGSAQPRLFDEPDWLRPSAIAAS